MSTDVRPELSERNKYWISRHRFYELKHFCLQYPEWSKAVTELGFLPSRTFDGTNVSRSSNVNDPTYDSAMKRFKYLEWMQLVDDTANDASHDLYLWLMMGVTKGITYPTLSTLYGIPCCRDTYYEVYRRFFWLLDQKRG